MPNNVVHSVPSGGTRNIRRYSHLRNCAWSDNMLPELLCAALAHPADWNTPAYNDADRPNASRNTNAVIGVAYKSAFSNFASVWPTASFIWSSKLVFDTLVLVRKTVPG